jgi:hypothetical protein
MYIEIEKISDDKLSCKYYKFWISSEYRPQLQIIFETFAERTRKTKRCKWVNDRLYSRLNRRNSDILRQDVTIPESIIKEMKDILKKAIDEASVQMEIR